MTVTSGFFDSQSGDRKFNSEQMARIYEGIITEGVFAAVGGGLVVSSAGGMVVNVAPGRAWFFNTWTLNDATLALTLDAAEVALNRVDTVILEVNKNSNVRANSIKISKGTPATNPVAATLVNTSTVKQYALAEVYVGMGTTAIGAGNIANKIGTTNTPFVTGPLTTIDASTLFGRFESDFYEWLGTLEDELSSNQAANLQTQLLSLAAEIDSGWNENIQGEAWVYASATSVTVPADATAKYRRGMRLRFKQGGAYKYFYITNVTSTVLTLNAGSDYSVANATITDIWISNMDNPVGFPMEFNWNPAFPNLIVGPGTMIAKFSWHAGMVYGHIDFVCGVGSGFTGVGTFYLPLPVTSYSLPSSSRRIIGNVGILDSGTTVFTGSVGTNGSSTLGDVRVGNANGTYSELSNLGPSTPMVWATGDSIGIQFSYAP